MRFILKALSSYLFRHPAQLSLAVIGMAVGIAVIIAVDMANDSARRSFDQSLSAVTGEATHQILGGPTGVDENLYVNLRLNGIRDVAPVVEGFVQLKQQTFQLLGVDVFAEINFRQYQLRTNGDQNRAVNNSTPEMLGIMTAKGGILMNSATAKELGLEKDDIFKITVAGHEYDGKLVGQFDKTGAASGFERIIITDISTAQEWLGLQGRLSRIDIKGNNLDVIKQHLPLDTRLVNSGGRNNSILEMSTGFNTSLTAMSLFALLVGVFLIYNCMSFMVLQRRGMIGVLRAIGVTRKQLLMALVFEGLLIAVVGIFLGVGLGFYLGQQLVTLVSMTISDHYYAVGDVIPTLGEFTVLKGILAGIVATLIAVSVPAAEALSYPPRLTLMASVIEVKAEKFLWWMAGFAAVFLIMAGVSLGLSSANLYVGFLALFFVILSAALLSPLVVKTVTPILAIIMGEIAGLPGRIAVRGVSRSLSRTGVAIAALSIAVAEIVGMGVMIGSFRENVEDWLITSLHPDIFVSVPARGGGINMIGVGPDVVEMIRDDPAIREVSTLRRVSIENEKGTLRINAVQLAPGGIGAFDFLKGDGDKIWPSFFAGNGVIVTDPYAYRNDIEVGDFISLPSPSGEKKFPVLGIYRDYNSDQGIVTMDRETYVAHWHDEIISSLGLYVSDHDDVDRVLDHLRETTAPYQSLIMGSNKTIRDISLEIFDRTFVVTGVLYWLAMIVAFVGILAAALALSLERGRELAILRALGMTRRQIANLVAIQCGTMGFLAGLFALPVGIASGWLLIDVINRRAFGWQIDMILPLDGLVTAVLIAVITALIASLYPAWISAGSVPALKMREE